MLHWVVELCCSDAAAALLPSMWGLVCFSVCSALICRQVSLCKHTRLWHGMLAWAWCAKQESPCGPDSMTRDLASVVLGVAPAVQSFFCFNFVFPAGLGASLAIDAHQTIRMSTWTSWTTGKTSGFARSHLWVQPIGSSNARSMDQV